MKHLKKAVALLLMLVFVGSGVLTNVGTISHVEAAPKISAKKKTLKQGKKLTLKISGAKGAIKWSVNNDNVKLNKATGKKVKVTAVKAGKSKVTAKVKGKKLTCTIKVNGLNIVNKKLNVGQSFKLKATGLGKKIKWSVSNKNVAIKVSKKVNVTVTAKTEGTSVITAKVGKKKYNCVVDVKAVTVPTPTPTPTPMPEPEPEPITPSQALDKVDFLVEVESGREPVVLQLSAPQIIDPTQDRRPTPLSAGEKAYWAPENIDKRLYDSLTETIEATNPDLILLTGDLIYGEFDDNGSVLLGLIEKMESFGIPWAPIFGNHDNESAMGVDWQCEQFEQAEHCLFKQRTLTGNGNYTVGIKQDGVLKRVFFMMDSNGCGAMHANSLANGHSTTSVGFGQDQMDWSINLAKEIKEISPDTKISFAFHIQVYAFKDAYAKYGFTNSGTKENPINIDKLENKAEGDFGYLGRDLKGPWDSGNTFYNRMKAVGVDSIFVGHEHCNSASVVHDGIRFQYGQKIGTYDRANYVTKDGAISGGYCLDYQNSALEPMSGGTVMKLSATDASIVDAYIYLSGDAQAKLDGTYEKPKEEPEEEPTVPEEPVIAVNGLQFGTDMTSDGITIVTATTMAEENAWKFDTNGTQSKVFVNTALLEGKTKFTFSIYVPEESTTTMELPDKPLFAMRYKESATATKPSFGTCENGYIIFSTTTEREERKLEYGVWQTITIDLSERTATCSEFAFNMGAGNIFYVKDIAFE